MCTNPSPHQMTQPGGDVITGHCAAGRQLQASVSRVPQARRCIVFAYWGIVSLISKVIPSRRGKVSSSAIVIVPPAWTWTFTSSPTFSLASWSKAESKMIPWELPILGMVLTRCKTMYYPALWQQRV